MGFANAIVGGGGQIVRRVMKSLGYTPNTSGWQLSRNGDAEFNSALIRGTMTIGTSGGASIVLSQTIPAVLSTWASTHSVTFAGVIVNYLDGTSFEWEGVGTYFGNAEYMVGTYDPTNGVVLTDRMSLGVTGQIQRFIGSRITNPTVTVMDEYDNAQIRIFRQEQADIILDGRSIAGGILGATTSSQGTVVTAVGAGTEVAVPAAKWDNQPAITYAKGRLFRVNLVGGCYDSAGVNGQAILNLYQSANPTIGVSPHLAQFRVESVAGIGANVPSFSHTCYIKNTTANDVLDKLTLSVKNSIGATNFSLYGDTTTPFPLAIVVEDIGTVADQPALASIAKSLV